MKDGRLAWSGWILAAGLAGVMAGSGFQTPSIKLGVVDLNNVLEKSEVGKLTKKNFDDMKKARESILEFVDQYRVLTIEQATKIKELTLKKDRTKPEDAELDRIKADAIAASKRSQELATKASLTPEERTLVEEYSRRSQVMNDLSNRWLREFADEMKNWVSDRKDENYQKARLAVNEVAAKEGYTMIFEGTVALYGANDITDPTLVALNAKP